MSTTTFILKGLLTTSLLILISLWGGRSDDIRLVLIYLAPYAAAAVLPVKFTDLASELVLGAVLVELPFTVLFSFFGGIFPDSHVLALMRITSVIFAVLAVVGVMAKRKTDQKTGYFIGGASASVTYILIAVFVLSSSSNSAEIQPDPTATLSSIHTCLALYAEKHQGQYPRGLNELGPHGSQCLDAWLAKGYAGNMRITYHPQGKATAGNYSLLMANGSWFKKSFSFFTDKSGMIHESFTSHSASAEDRVIENASSTLRAIANCLIQRGAPYPRDVQHFPEDSKLRCSRKSIESGVLHYGIHDAEMKYAPKLDHALIKGFTLMARPMSYGKDGVRSYFVDETGIVRGTTENRPAGPDDSPVPGCEYDFNPCHGS
jgi:hypothetical protein